MYSLRHYKNNLEPVACLELFPIFHLERLQALLNTSTMQNSIGNNRKYIAPTGVKAKDRICTTFTRASITAITKYAENKGFLCEQDAIRFIVNAVLVKEGLLLPTAQ